MTGLLIFLKRLFGVPLTARETIYGAKVPILIAIPKPQPKENSVQKMSPAGLELTKYCEACFLKAYQDSVGVWTIGWGAIVMPNGERVKEGDEVHQELADAMLISQVETEGAHYVRAWAGNRTQQQFDALTDFTYNRGAGRLRDLLAMPGEVSHNMLSFDWAGDPPKVLLGLQRRRRMDQAMYNGLDWTVYKSWRP